MQRSSGNASAEKSEPPLVSITRDRSIREKLKLVEIIELVASGERNWGQHGAETFQMLF